MARVALLIGVSRYSTGLDPLPDAQKDTSAMQRVLRQCHFETVERLCDRDRQTMQEGIELFFKHRTPDDHILFLFSGYILQDRDGQLYLATPSTGLDPEGAIVKAHTIPVSVLQEAMNASPAKPQVIIIDSYIYPPRHQPTPAERSDTTVSTQFEGAGRAILMATDTNRRAVPPAELDVLTYTRYLIEGIESGAADTDDDGTIAAADAHQYATRKLKIAAPGLKPQLYGSAETAQMPLFRVPVHDPHIRYRKILEAAAANAIDIDGEPVLEGGSVLNDTRYQLGLTPQDAAAIKTQVLRPQRDYWQRLELYQEQAAEIMRSHGTASPTLRTTLKQLQASLGLTDRNVVMLTVAPLLAAQQNQTAQHQQHLAQYQQVLLRAMQRQYPLRDGDRAVLQRLQQTLQLKDDDVQAIEAQITTQARQFLDVSPDAPEAPAGHTRTLIPPPPPPPGRVPAAELSDAQRAVLNLLMNPGGQPPEIPVTPAPTPRPTPAPTFPPSPPREEPRRILQTPDSTPTVMDRFRRSASNYQALIIPAILLAIIIGLLAAVLPTANRPSWLNLDWLKFGQAPVNRLAAQQWNTAGLQKTQQGDNKAAIDNYNKAIEQNPKDATLYLNRGISYHKLGNTGAAINDYQRAIKLNPNLASAHSNLSYAYYDRKNYDQALEEGNTAVALDGRLPQAHINLANARSKKGDYVGAIRDYNQAITLRPPATILAGAYNNRGNAQFALGKTRDAVNDYNAAIRLQPDYADAYYNLGLAEAALGDRNAAVRHLQTAANLFLNQGNPQQQREATDRANEIQQGQSPNGSALKAT